MRVVSKAKAAKHAKQAKHAAAAEDETLAPGVAVLAAPRPPPPPQSLRRGPGALPEATAAAARVGVPPTHTLF